MNDTNLYESLFETSFEAAIIVADDGREARLNRAAREFRGLDLAALFEEPSGDANLARFRRDLSAAGHAILTLRLADAEGQGRHVELVGKRAGKVFLVVARDATERSFLNDDMAKLPREESVGDLAAGLAHDFNNLQAVIVCSSAALASAVEGREDLLELVDEIRLAADRATSIARQLLSPERNRPRLRQALSINDAIADIRPLLERIVGPNVELSLALNAGAGEATMDREAFERALLNLAANARDAMPDGGRLTIGTRAVRLGEDEPAEWGGDYAAISVSDTGVGMSREVRDRIFDRFYTTKSPNRGTGLGLSIVQRFVAESDGCVSVHSAPGEGTTFALYLPRTGCEKQASSGSVAARCMCV
jgi:two-component system, cell cycle sensor histidine kinase and response regulator CckA